MFVRLSRTERINQGKYDCNMTRNESQINADAEIEEFRPLTFATMMVLEKLNNKALALILNPKVPGIIADTEDLLEFLYVHFRENEITTMRRLLTDKEKFMDAVYTWAENTSPEVIGKGIEYFLGTKEQVKLTSVEPIREPNKKSKESKNSRRQQ